MCRADLLALTRALTDEPIRVTIIEVYSENIVGTAPSFGAPTLTLQFATDKNPSLMVPASGFEWIDLTAYSSRAVSKMLVGCAVYSLGWGYGLDERFPNFEAAGDQVQVIDSTTTTLYRAPSSDPTILLISTAAERASFGPGLNCRLEGDNSRCEFS